MSAEPNESSVVPFHRPRQPSIPAAEHPAYDHLFLAFSIMGMNVSTALTAVARWWSKDYPDIPLPSYTTICDWAKRDDWRLKAYRSIANSNARYRVETIIQVRAQVPGALQTIDDVQHGRIVKDLAGNALRAAQSIMAMAAMMGDIAPQEEAIYLDSFDMQNPEHDLSTEALIHVAAADYRRERNSAERKTP